MSPSRRRILLVMPPLWILLCYLQVQKLTHIGVQVGQETGMVLQHVREDIRLQDHLSISLGSGLGLLQILPGAEVRVLC